MDRDVDDDDSLSSDSKDDGTHFPNSVNRVWTEEEDKILMETVQEKGCDWKQITNILMERTQNEKSAKQCRERWKHHVNPNITKEQFTDQEARIIFLAHKESGNKWVNIAKLLPGRSDNQIKNFFYCKLRKVIRTFNKEFRRIEKFKKLHLNESILFKLMKKMNITLGEVSSLPLDVVGNSLLQIRRKKRSSKKGNSVIPKAVLVPSLSDEEEKSRCPVPKHTATPPIDQQKPKSLPAAPPSSRRPTPLPRAANGSPFTRQMFFAMSPAIPEPRVGLNSPNFTAFTPCCPAFQPQEFPMSPSPKMPLSLYSPQAVQSPLVFEYPDYLPLSTAMPESMPAYAREYPAPLVTAPVTVEGPQKVVRDAEAFDKGIKKRPAVPALNLDEIKN